MHFDVIDPAADIRLVVVDMDGTFLDAEGRIPAAAWEVLDRLHERGVVFAPASGRQHARLAEQFARLAGPLTIIAENGGVVMRGDEQVDSNVMDDAQVRKVITLLRDAGPELQVPVVRCGPRMAYLQRPDPTFVRAAEPYYARTRAVDDLLEVKDETIKLAVYCPGRTAEVARLLEAVRGQLQVAVSGQSWVDVMNLGVHKGVAVSSLQRSLGIGPQHTAVFGDYLNDLEMLDTASHSFAMANAHERVRHSASYLAPPNTEHGVLQVLRAWLAGEDQLEPAAAR